MDTTTAIAALTAAVLLCDWWVRRRAERER
jgi:hypothetical protein